MSPELSLESVRTLPAGNLINSSRFCPICQQVLLQGRQRVCSGKCRITQSRKRREEKLRERNAKVRSLLQEVLNLLDANEKDSCIGLDRP